MVTSSQVFVCSQKEIEMDGWLHEMVGIYDIPGARGMKRN